MKGPGTLTLRTSAPGELVPLATIYGPIWISVAEVAVIGAYFAKPGEPPQRWILLKGGAKLYILNDGANLATLIDATDAARIAKDGAPKAVKGSKLSKDHEKAATRPVGARKGGWGRRRQAGGDSPAGEAGE